MAYEQTAALDTPETRGVKRARNETAEATVDDKSNSMHKALKAEATAQDIPATHVDEHDHEEYELIEVPKRRNSNLISLPPHSEGRNLANVPLTAIRHDGKKVILWAKLDTASDANTINRSTLEKLVGKSQIRNRMRTMDEEDFATLSGVTFKVMHHVELTFWAGAGKKFENIPFVVDEKGTEVDGLPDVLLGWPTLRAHHMVMIDIDFLGPYDLSLPVIAEMAEAELNSDQPCEGRILLTKYETRPGPIPPKGVRR